MFDEDKKYYMYTKEEDFVLGLVQSDLFRCEHCNLRADKWDMVIHCHPEVGKQ